MAINHTQYSSQLAQYNQRYSKNPFMPRQTPVVTQHQPQSHPIQQSHHHTPVSQPRKVFDQQWNDKVTLTPKPGQPVKVFATHARKGSFNDIPKHGNNGTTSYKPYEDHLHTLLNDNIDHTAIQQEIYQRNPVAATYKVEVPYLRYEPEYNNSTVPPRMKPLTSANPKANISSFNIIANNEIVPVKPSLKPLDDIQKHYNDATRAGSRPQSSTGKAQKPNINTATTNPILQQHIPLPPPTTEKAVPPVWISGNENIDSSNNQSHGIKHHDNWKSYQMSNVFSTEQNLQQETQKRLQHSASKAYLQDDYINNTNTVDETPHQAAARHKLKASASRQSLW